MKVVVRNDMATEPYEFQLTIFLSEGPPLYKAWQIYNFDELPTLERFFTGWSK